MTGNSFFGALLTVLAVVTSGEILQTNSVLDTDHFLADTEDCSVYYALVKHVCSPGLLFDPRQQICDEPDNVQCACNTQGNDTDCKGRISHYESTERSTVTSDTSTYESTYREESTAWHEIPESSPTDSETTSHVTTNWGTDDGWNVTAGSSVTRSVDETNECTTSGGEQGKAQGNDTDCKGRKSHYESTEHNTVTSDTSAYESTNREESTTWHEIPESSQTHSETTSHVTTNWGTDDGWNVTSGSSVTRSVDETNESTTSRGEQGKGKFVVKKLLSLFEDNILKKIFLTKNLIFVVDVAEGIGAKFLSLQIDIIKIFIQLFYRLFVQRLFGLITYSQKAEVIIPMKRYSILSILGKLNQIKQVREKTTNATAAAEATVTEIRRAKQEAVIVWFATSKSYATTSSVTQEMKQNHTVVCIGVGNEYDAEQLGALSSDGSVYDIKSSLEITSIIQKTGIQITTWGKDIFHLGTEFSA